ncbi:MAG: methyltransferase domain-containing protein [SAR324 cluster bacterium]|nr:methyltransferase domain-containing protein [SAR324 cluster bacterium]
MYKLSHDIENDLEHTIPPEGGWDSALLFEVMTERSLDLLEAGSQSRVMDQACGMGQDLLSVAARQVSASVALSPRGITPGTAFAGFALGLEPSNRMIRFAQLMARRQGNTVRGRVLLLRSLAEAMPIRENCLDAVLCKGAMDHFIDPHMALAEIARILKPGGRAVVALANYDSLSCRLGRRLDILQRRLRPGYAPADHPYFEPPPDHMTRFGFRDIATLPAPPLHIRRVEGISLLWGFPPWTRLVALAPPLLRRVLLNTAFVLGRLLPRWADVIIVQAVKDGGSFAT